jgi:DNA-binding NtrC family response regulator
LFLDELGEMPVSTQAKLLRVLESGEVLRVGSLKPRVIDARFIAATNRDLPLVVDRGEFRRDLFFRLNGITLTIPPLRDRLDEIPGLASHFLTELARKGGREPARLSAQSLAVLRKHSWPGNIRELRNVVERGAALSQYTVIEPQHLLLEPSAPPRRRAAAPVRERSEHDPLIDRRSGTPVDLETERARILEALDQCGGNQSKACVLLGISRRTLVHRLDELQLRRPKK